MTVGDATTVSDSPSGIGAEQKTLFPDIEQAAPRRYRTGILPYQQIEELLAARRILSPHSLDPDQVQPASLDLRLGPVAYRVDASFLPGERSSVASKIAELGAYELDLSRPQVLERGCVYIVPLMEELRLPGNVSAKANPKSTTGRLDIFTRLITDFSAEFEWVRAGYRGPLFVEVVPRTFSVRVRQGTKLNQLRFIRGTPPPSDSELAKLHIDQRIVFSHDEEPADPLIREGLWLRVDLNGSNSSEIIGYKGKRTASPIDLAKLAHYDPHDFWEPVTKNRKRSLVLNPDDFYILVSKERVRVPLSHAADMVPYDSSIGEFRVHYAGFFDPGFGYSTTDVKGTPAVLEVRSHEVPFLLEDGQTVARLVFERLVECAAKTYGVGIGSSYQSQALTLSKQFKRS